VSIRCGDKTIQVASFSAKAFSQEESRARGRRPLEGKLKRDLFRAPFVNACPTFADAG